MFFGIPEPIWFYQRPVHFRNQIDGLALIASAQLKINPLSGQLFIFRNTKADKLKFLWWDKNRFWLLYSRLEKGRFQLPEIKDNVLELSKDQLNMLLAGLDFRKFAYLKKVEAEHFY